MVGPARRRRDLRAIVAHRHQFHRDPRTARDGADDADEGNRAEHAPRPLEARTEVDDIDRAAVLRLQPGDEDRGIAAIAGRRLDLSREAKAPDALMLPLAAQQRAEHGVAVDARDAAPDQSRLAVDQRADLAIDRKSDVWGKRG